jgi:metal-responsive CopG/Arc/MetJ family transcriptional regulator
MTQERNSIVKPTIKTRAPKENIEWCSISIPKYLYEKLEELSKERRQSISLIVRDHIELLFDSK